MLCLCFSHEFFIFCSSENTSTLICRNIAQKQIRCKSKCRMYMSLKWGGHKGAPSQTVLGTQEPFYVNHRSTAEKVGPSAPIRGRNSKSNLTSWNARQICVSGAQSRGVKREVDLASERHLFLLEHKNLSVNKQKSV